MDPIRAKFYQAAFEILDGKNRLELMGLVSERGITKVFAPADWGDPWRKKLGKAVTIRLDGIQLQAVLLERFVENGSFLELRFLDLQEPHRNYIRQRILTEGISPGWKRNFPRIAIHGNEEPDLPVPTLCMVRSAGVEVFVNVLNFTLGGLRVETVGDDLQAVRVGALLHFDLVASNGTVMPGLEAEVRNMAVHEHEKDGRITCTRSFGLRFAEMSQSNRERYFGLIREYCLALQKKLNP